MQELLSRWTLEAYLSTKPPSPVIELYSNTTVGQALRILASHNITSAPVFEAGTRTYLGFVDLDDVLQLLLNLVNVRELNEDNRVYKLRAAGLQLEHQPLSVLLPGQDGALIYKADLSSSLLDVILHGFLEPAGGNQAVVHRVGVFEEAEEAEDARGQAMNEDGPAAAAAAAANGCQSSAGGSRGGGAVGEEDGQSGGIPGIRITHVVSQSDILRFVLKRLGGLSSEWPLAGISLADMGFTAAPVMCVPQEMSTINALATMVANQVSCVGVVSHSQGGGLAAQLSAQVLRGLLPQQFAALGDPVMTFLSSQAASSAAGKPSGGRGSPGGPAQAAGLKGSEPLKPLPVVKCDRSMPLLAAIQQMVATHAHRVFVVDERQRPVGIMTQTDVLRKLVGWSPGLSDMGDLDVDQVDQEVDQAMEEDSEVPDCGLEPGEELVEGPVGLRGVASAAALAGWA